MTEQEDDQCYEIIEALHKTLKAVVDAATATLTPEQDDQVRMLITENARFWRAP